MFALRIQHENKGKTNEVTVDSQNLDENIFSFPSHKNTRLYIGLIFYYLFNAILVFIVLFSFIVVD